MLKHVPAFIDADLLWVLAAMGHGDELAVVDRNFPARSVALETQSGKLITLGGMDAPGSIGGILELLPLDSFVDAPLRWMDSSVEPGIVLPVHADVLDVCRRAEGREVQHAVIERHNSTPPPRSVSPWCRTAKTVLTGVLSSRKALFTTCDAPGYFSSGEKKPAKAGF